MSSAPQFSLEGDGACFWATVAARAWGARGRVPSDTTQGALEPRGEAGGVQRLRLGAFTCRLRHVCRGRHRQDPAFQPPGRAGHGLRDGGREALLRAPPGVLQHGRGVQRASVGQWPGAGVRAEARVPPLQEPLERAGSTLVELAAAEHGGTDSCEARSLAQTEPHGALEGRLALRPCEL